MRPVAPHVAGSAWSVYIYVPLSLATPVSRAKADETIEMPLVWYGALCEGRTLTTPGEYDCARRCGLVSNYFEQMRVYGLGVCCVFRRRLRSG